MKIRELLDSMKNTKVSKETADDLELLLAEILDKEIEVFDREEYEMKRAMEILEGRR